MVRPRYHAACALAAGLLIAGCGGSSSAQPKPTARIKHRATATAAPSVTSTAASLPTPTSSPVAPTATATARATATPTLQTPTIVASSPPQLLSANLAPATVAPAGSMSATVQTSGDVARVQLYIGSGSPSGAAPTSYDLTESSSGVWTAGVAAPAIPGQYHFTVGIFGKSGHRNVVDNDNWNFTVQSAPAGAQPIPADLPLAPPFSYSNPVAATFTAEGSTVQGSEVSSDSRPDVPVKAVADFYLARFPRAGWTIDSSTIPSSGAASIDLVATAGKQVAVVTYAQGTVNIFYGTLP